VRPPLSFLVPFGFVLAAAPVAGTQVPLGHAVVVGANAATAPVLWLLEPLDPRLVPLDVSALPNPWRVSAVHVLGGGQRILLAASTPSAAADAVFATTLAGTTLTTPQPFVQGLRGRAIAMFVAPAIAELVVVTADAVFAAPLTGGSARALTATPSSMDNVAAVLIDQSTVLATAVDPLGQAVLWRLDVGTQQLGRLPLGMTGRLVLAEGPRVDTALVGEASGQVWLVDLSNVGRSPYVQLPRGPLHALWDYRDQQGQLAAIGSDLVRISRQTVGPALPLPGVAIDVAYRAYQSQVTTYGVACRGSSSRLPDVGWQGRPVPGNDTFAVTVGNARASTAAAMMVGATATNLALDRFGMPSCVLLTQPLVSIPASTTTTGFAQLPLAIPPDPGLAGLRLFVQWLVVDPGTNTASLVLSNGAALQV
jgi:hypothetical protein